MFDDTTPYTYDGQFVDQEYDLPPALDPTGTPSWDFQFSGIGQLLKGLGLDTSSGSVLKSLGSLFTGTSEHGKIGQLLGMGGLGAILSRMGDSGQAPVGYQGGVPTYIAQRSQTPAAQQRPEGYRPGQGGITYFNPIQYQGRKNLSAPMAPPAVPTAPNVQVPNNPPATDTETFAMGGNVGIAGLERFAKGGSSGRYLRGPGDGVSDHIPAQLESGQPAKLADGEFVIPARVVSEIGNGSSDAGARKLYAMLDRVEAMARKSKRGKPSGADRELKKLA
jgi:hypothetical protein